MLSSHRLWPSRCSWPVATRCRPVRPRQDVLLHGVGESLVVVGRGHEVACRWTSALALPMATLRPLRRNISTSVG